MTDTDPRSTSGFERENLEREIAERGEAIRKAELLEQALARHADRYVPKAEPEPVRRRSAAGATGQQWQDWIERRERSLTRSLSQAVAQTIGQDVIALEQRCERLEAELAELRQERGARLRSVPPAPALIA